jgi:drug/metabolite transporter (DMT)-like permease
VTAASLALVLLAACLHATWNLLAKRAGGAGVSFVWLCAVTATAIYTPVALITVVVTSPDFDATDIGFLVGSGTLHACYFTLLQHGYRVGDLSVVYPLARGTGPMLSTLAAILFLSERPTTVALTGAALICAGVFVLGRASAGRADGDTRAGVAFGLLTGVLIATYTLWDRHTVAVLGVSPIILDWAANATRAVLLTPFAARSRIPVAKVWATYRREVVGTALLSPLAYILVLFALRLSPVSYVAPAREASILIGTILGVRLLKEGQLTLRLTGAGAIVVGLIALALG